MAGNIKYKYENKFTGDVHIQDEKHARLSSNGRWKESRVRVKAAEKASEGDAGDSNDSTGSDDPGAEGQGE